MPAYAQTLTTAFAVGTAFMQVGIVAVLAHRIFSGRWLPAGLETVFERFGLWLAALLAGAALLLSLWYSEIVGIPVCALCWFARTMMYPMAVMLPLVAWHRDIGIVRYVLPLAFTGSLISGYQHLMQVGFLPAGACAALQGGGDCAARYVFELGYVTMPLFGFTMFVAIGLMVWIIRAGIRD